MTTYNRYRMIEGAPVNVKDFGAKGDGVTDDTAAIQDALNTGGDVYIPEGVYIVTSLLLTDGNTVHGDGEKSILKRKDNHQITQQQCIDDYGLDSSVLSGIKVSNIELRNFTVDGNQQTNR